MSDVEKTAVADAPHDHRVEKLGEPGQPGQLTEEATVGAILCLYVWQRIRGI